MKEFYGILKRCPLFEGIPMEDLDAMLNCIGGHTIAAKVDIAFSCSARYNGCKKDPPSG